MFQHWTEKEVAASTLPDTRLNPRLSRILTVLGRAPERSIPASCSNWTDTVGVYRFLDNARVDAEGILSGHRQATRERIAQESLVFVAQDTTDISYSRLSAIGLGTLKKRAISHCHLHLSVALTPARVNLGVLKSTFWQREGGLDEHDQRRPEHRALAERESYRWLDHYLDACALAASAPQTCVVMLADRESDMHDIFEQAEKQPADARAEYIIRAKSNRDTLGQHLWQELAAAPIAGSFTLQVAKRGKQRARQAHMELRFRQVTFPGSRNYRRVPVTVYVVHAKESHAPRGVAPIEWMLVTSLEVGCVEEARTIVEWYSKRWEIEIFFRVLKQGCRIESLRLQTSTRIENALAVYLIIAWRIHVITMLGRAHPTSTADLIFGYLEWQTIYLMANKKPPPEEPPSLRDATRQLAQLGGFLARKGDGEPGVQSLWIGYQRILEFLLARQTIEHVAQQRGAKRCV